MKMQPLQSGSKNIQLSNGRAGGWLATGLGVAAVLAIGLAVYAAARLAAAPSMPNPAVQSAPSANVQSVSAYLAAHGAGAANPPLRVPQANLLSEQAHRAGATARNGQLVPEAAVQSVTSYLRAHGVVIAGQP